MDRNVADRLIGVGRLLVDQERARTLAEPRAREGGFWFGGGNICPGPDGRLWLVGRYRNGGDSRTGIEAGPRGAELALLSSSDGGASFEHAFSFLKKDLVCNGEEVLSIEGASLYTGRSGVELYVSSEKKRRYPEHVAGFQKAGTGVWSIDVLKAQTVEKLRLAPVRRALSSDEAVRLHVKDPVVFEMDGRRVMLYCHHPFSWASSNTGYAVSDPDSDTWENIECPVLGRGPAWDVAVCRITERLEVPAVGILAGRPPISLYFYDGAECVHDHRGKGPKGFSCEEIGGLAWGVDEDFPRLERLSMETPLFVSPWGTGCSRYVSVFEGADCYMATWQQSQRDGSQPLVVNRVAKSEVERILTG